MRCERASLDTDPHVRYDWKTRDISEAFNLQHNTPRSVVFRDTMRSESLELKPAEAGPLEDDQNVKFFFKTRTQKKHF